MMPCFLTYHNYNHYFILQSLNFIGEIPRTIDANILTVLWYILIIYLQKYIWLNVSTIMIKVQSEMCFTHSKYS